jgi:hypothetical protein
MDTNLEYDERITIVLGFEYTKGKIQVAELLFAEDIEIIINY